MERSHSHKSGEEPSRERLAALRMCSFFHSDGNTEFSGLLKETSVHLLIVMGLGHVLKHFSKGPGAHYHKKRFHWFVGFFRDTTILRLSR